MHGDFTNTDGNTTIEDETDRNGIFTPFLQSN